MFHSTQLYFERTAFLSGESDVWLDEPNLCGLVIYSYITPLISLFGICGNIMCLIVLIRHEFKASIYTYLLVLAITDLANSTLLFVSGLSRGILWYKPGWSQYEALIGLPLGGIFSCISVTATVAVALDRVVYLWNPTRCYQPKFCRRETARKIMFVGCVVSILFNIPYCFIYQWKSDGKLETTKFFESKIYGIHNWIKFTVFGLIPAIILIFGNSFLIYSLKRMGRIMAECQKSFSIKRNNHKIKDQKLVTITLISIVFLFLIGEFPTHLASRKTAVTILFSGDQDRADKSKTLEIFRQIATMLNAINISANFIVYSLFCPLFCKSLKKTFARSKKPVATNVQVNVFVLQTNGHNLQIPMIAKDANKILGLFGLQNQNKKLMQLMIKE